ncbi:MAG: TonB-dependent receptor [Rhodospirillaceae bacterium]|nr:TonB-dependent receptor [Rhodospirillaceae bacterium]
MTRAHLLRAASSLAVMTAMAGADLAVAQGIEEIVVTARKRAENLQEVPLAITAFTNESLRLKNVQSIHDVANYTPGFTMDRGFGRDFDRPVIRGQSTIQGEANASFFIDGVFVAGSITSSTIDAVERIEVVRGPQAALYGRRTFAGAINYITKGPSNEFEGQINGKLGSHRTYKGSMWMRGPIIADKLQYMIAANWDYYGGEWRNTLAPNPPNPLTSPVPTGPRAYTVAPDRGDTSRIGFEETQDVTAKLKLIASDTVDFNLKSSYTRQDDSQRATFLVGANELNCFLPVAGTPTATQGGYYCGEINTKGRAPNINVPDFSDGTTGSAPVPLPANLATVSSLRRTDGTFGTTPVAAPGLRPGIYRDVYRNVADMQMDVNEWEILLQGAYNREGRDRAFDADVTGERLSAIPRSAPAFVVATGAGVFQAHDQVRIEDYSGEFRVTSPGENRLRGLGGVYYYKENTKSRTRTFSARGFAVFLDNGGDFTRNSVENVAVFGQLEFDFSDRLTMSVEGRYSEDKLGLKTTTPALVAVVDLDGKFTSFTPRITVDYRVTDDVMLFALAAKGNKPGGFNSGLASNLSLPQHIADGTLFIDEEQSWNYEAGFKSTWWDGKATTNVSAFYIDWDKQQLTSVTNIINAAGQASTAPILVNLGVTRVKGVEVETGFALTEQISASASYAYVDPIIRVGDDPEQFAFTGVSDPTLANGGNLRGQQTPNSAKHQISLSATYRDALTSDVDWYLTNDLNFKSKRYDQVFNLAHTGDTYYWNARLGVQTETWNLFAWVDNILEDDDPTNILRFRDFRVASPANPAIYMRGFETGLPKGRNFGITGTYNF